MGQAVVRYFASSCAPTYPLEEGTGCHQRGLGGQAETPPTELRCSAPSPVRQPSRSINTSSSSSTAPQRMESNSTTTRGYSLCHARGISRPLSSGGLGVHSGSGEGGGPAGSVEHPHPLGLLRTSISKSELSIISWCQVPPAAACCCYPPSYVTISLSCLRFPQDLTTASVYITHPFTHPSAHLFHRGRYDWQYQTCPPPPFPTKKGHIRVCSRKGVGARTWTDQALVSKSNRRGHGDAPRENQTRSRTTIQKSGAFN